MTELKPLALSVKIVIRDSSGRILLLKRSIKSKGNPGKWDLPGGKLDPGESFDSGIIREVKEETGLEAMITGAVGTAYSESETHRIVYLILEGTANDAPPVLSEEHEEYMWAEPREYTRLDVVPQLRQIDIKR